MAKATVLKVPDMTCGHCELSAQEALDSLDGLEREGRPRDGRRRGRLRRRKVNIEQMGETIEEVGYTLRSKCRTAWINEPCGAGEKIRFAPALRWLSGPESRRPSRHRLYSVRRHGGRGARCSGAPGQGLVGRHLVHRSGLDHLYVGPPCQSPRARGCDSGRGRAARPRSRGRSPSRS
jgi:copper chaperone